MHRNTLGVIVAAAVGILLISAAGAGQPSAKMATIGILQLGQGSPAFFETLQGTLRALGYIEGETVTFVIRQAGGKEEILPTLAAELVQLPVDVLFAGGDAAVRAAKAATRTKSASAGSTNSPRAPITSRAIARQWHFTRCTPFWRRTR